MILASTRYSSSFVTDFLEPESFETQSPSARIKENLASKSQGLQELKKSIDHLISAKNQAKTRGQFSSSLISEKPMIVKGKEPNLTAQKEQISPVHHILDRLAQKPNLRSFKGLKSAKKVNTTEKKQTLFKEKSSQANSEERRPPKPRTSFLGHVEKIKTAKEAGVQKGNSSVEKELNKSSKETGLNHPQSNAKPTPRKSAENIGGKTKSPKSSPDQPRTKHLINYSEGKLETFRKHQVIATNLKEKTAALKQLPHKMKSKSNTSGTSSGFSAHIKSNSSRTDSSVRRRAMMKGNPGAVLPNTHQKLAKSGKPPTSFVNFESHKSQNFDPKPEILKKYSMVTENEEYYKCRGTQKLSFLSFHDPNFQRNQDSSLTLSPDTKKHEESAASSSSSPIEGLLNSSLFSAKQWSMRAIGSERPKSPDKSKMMGMGAMSPAGKEETETQGRCSPVEEVELENEDEESINQGLHGSSKNQKETLSTLPPTTTGEPSSGRFSFCISPSSDSAKIRENGLKKLKEDLKRVKYEINQRMFNSIETTNFLAELRTQSF